jgi:ribosome-binding protein aMBF1 (putative translation factor)
MFATIRGLAAMPARCAATEESVDLEAEVRVLLYGKRSRCYKVYFAIHQDMKTVWVFPVRHWARRPMEIDELGDLMDETMGLEDDHNEERVHREARCRAGLRQEQLAQRMNTTQAVIARLEGGGSNPSTRTLERYARATGSRVKISFEPTEIR